MIKLYNSNLSPNCLRVRAVIYELETAVEIVDVDLMGGDTKKPEYLAMNPHGKVPVLAARDFFLFESRAINAYLASLDPEPRLYPADSKTRAVVDQWSFWQAIHLGPSSQRLSFERVFKKRLQRGEPDENVIATESKETAKLLGVLDAGLEERDWVAGSLSVADFALGSTLFARDAAGIDLGPTPNVSAWIARLEALPSWRRAIDDMPL